MIVSVKKWGNSASIRIPALIMEAAHLSLDQLVEIHEEEGRIVIEPIQKPKDELAFLLEGITKENQHEAVEFGKPMGKEVW